MVAMSVSMTTYILVYVNIFLNNADTTPFLMAPKTWMLTNITLQNKLFKCPYFKRYEMLKKGHNSIISEKNYHLELSFCLEIIY